MSWWQTVLGLGGLAAAPFTGGTTAAWAVPLITGGASTFASIYGANKQNSANNRALSTQDRANAQAMEIEREQMAESRRQFDLQQAAAKAALESQNKFEGDRWAASEEERLYDRRLRDEREARMAPRRAFAADALQRLPGLIASGRQSPGMGSFGSYRRA